jgi:L-ribulokinase
MAELKRYSLGLDFGTESVRALVVDIDNGDEAAQHSVSYPSGVISRRLPGASHDLPPDFALQDPRDYMNSCIEAISVVLKTVPASSIFGIGVDFTACTILPVLKDGTPLMMFPELAQEPHAWVKLWKHHGAKLEADRINELGRDRKEGFLKYYGGSISSEWMLPKCLEILRHAPSAYARAELIVDAGDWIVQQLTGTWTRNSCAAGYKGFWSEELGFPSKEFLTALDPGLSELSNKWLKNIIAPGELAGKVSDAFAKKSGLITGTPVSAATIDAHSGVAGMGVFHEGSISIIMGTSSCHMVLSSELKIFEGYGGVVKDGILPGFYGYESGQAAVGDLLAWYNKDLVGRSFEEMDQLASRLLPGEAGVVALDWQNGNRSVLMNPHLSGMFMGLTLQTRPEQIYRACVEATAMGTRKIIESYTKNAIPIHEIVVCGGLVKQDWILQIYSDVCGLPLKVASSSQAVALGAAIFGALAAEGGVARDHLENRIVRMTKPSTRTYKPETESKAIYDKLYSVYRSVHDYFGIQKPDLMKSLREIQGN